MTNTDRKFLKAAAIGLNIALAFALMGFGYNLAGFVPLFVAAMAITIEWFRFWGGHYHT